MTDSTWRPLRRQFLLGSAATIAGIGTAAARSYTGEQPWQAFADSPQAPVQPKGWEFFTAAEARTVEAIVNRLVPADGHSIGGKDAGCAIYIDRQLAGSYGRAADLYMLGPFPKGTAMQGFQSSMTPATQYREGLAALARYMQAQPGSASFADVPPAKQDEILKGLEAGKISLGDFDGKAFFERLLTNTMEGFFADPIYGGNKDMVSWKMIGFPGARYDYREYIGRHNEKITLKPIGLAGNDDWRRKG